MKQPNNKRFIPFILLLCGALLVLAVSAAFLWGANVRPVKAQAGAQLQPSTATPTRWFVPSRTPFKPRTYTPT
ncbi:MAG: hypothetical protein HY835_07025, partial [Anaerolineae bacterium]|nr:hypothetical protein [Anaerolineae bacterium]